METENTIRLVVLVASVILGIIAWWAGRTTRVVGLWQDGDRTIDIEQRGPWLRGRCERRGGFETYVGTAVFGTVRLRRHVHGSGYIQSLGIEPRSAPLLEGKVVATFRFTLAGDELRGEFRGHRFSFGGQPWQIERVTHLPAEPRVWVRQRRR